MKYKLGIIGAGVMANAIINCAIKKSIIAPSDIIVYDIDNKKVQELQQAGFQTANNINDITNTAKIVMLAVKPQHYSDILLSNDFSGVYHLISIMAGVKIHTIKSKLNNNLCSVTRIMPNTPCQIGKGFCGICFEETANNSDRDFILSLFNSCGEVMLINEDLFDTVTSISGSGPAYVYMFINGLIQGGINGGLSYEQAKKIAISTIIGSASLSKITDEAMSQLIDKVCSKGGTTIEAVEYYRNNSLENIIADGIDKCREKSKYLSDNL